MTVPVFALQDEEAGLAGEGDEGVWEDGDSGHQRLPKARIQGGDVAFQREGLVCPIGIQGMRPTGQRV